jgi:hypothetical protein
VTREEQIDNDGRGTDVADDDGMKEALDCDPGVRQTVRALRHRISVTIALTADGRLSRTGA